jgi:predicted ester cyclase
MNERINELKLHAGIQDNPDQEGLDLFAEMIVKDFYDICNQAWAFNEQEKAKEGASQAEQLVFAGAMAQCQKMKENIEQQFGVTE